MAVWGSPCSQMFEQGAEFGLRLISTEMYPQYQRWRYIALIQFQLLETTNILAKQKSIKNKTVTGKGWLRPLQDTQQVRYGQTWAEAVSGLVFQSCQEFLQEPSTYWRSFVNVIPN